MAKYDWENVHNENIIYMLNIKYEGTDFTVRLCINKHDQSEDKDMHYWGLDVTRKFDDGGRYIVFNYTFNINSNLEDLKNRAEELMEQIAHIQKLPKYGDEADPYAKFDEE
jgi:hypothetical protein